MAPLPSLRRRRGGTDGPCRVPAAHSGPPRVRGGCSAIPPRPPPLPPPPPPREVLAVPERWPGSFLARDLRIRVNWTLVKSRSISSGRFPELSIEKAVIRAFVSRIDHRGRASSCRQDEVDLHVMASPASSALVMGSADAISDSSCMVISLIDGRPPAIHRYADGRGIPAAEPHSNPTTWDPARIPLGDGAVVPAMFICNWHN